MKRHLRPYISSDRCMTLSADQYTILGEEYDNVDTVKFHAAATTALLRLHSSQGYCVAHLSQQPNIRGDIESLVRRFGGEEIEATLIGMYAPLHRLYLYPNPLCREIRQALEENAIPCDNIDYALMRLPFTETIPPLLTLIGSVLGILSGFNIAVVCLLTFAIILAIVLRLIDDPPDATYKVTFDIKTGGIDIQRTPEAKRDKAPLATGKTQTTFFGKRSRKTRGPALSGMEYVPPPKKSPSKVKHSWRKERRRQDTMASSAGTLVDTPTTIVKNQHYDPQGPLITEAMHLARLERHQLSQQRRKGNRRTAAHPTGSIAPPNDSPPPKTTHFKITKVPNGILAARTIPERQAPLEEQQRSQEGRDNLKQQPPPTANSKNEPQPRYNVLFQPISFDDRPLMGLLEKLKGHKLRAYLFGGAVRDKLCESFFKTRNSIDDFDIVVEGTDLPHIQQILNIEGSELIGTRHEILRVPLGNTHADITAYTASLKKFAHSLDFGVNSFLHNPLENKGIYDHCGAFDDLASKIIRTIRPPAKLLSEDPLTALRAIRLKSKTGFEFDEALLATMQSSLPSFRTTNRPRLRYEFGRLFREGRAVKNFEILVQTGVIDNLIPGYDRINKPETRVLYHHVIRKVLSDADRQYQRKQPINSTECILAAFLWGIVLEEQEIARTSQEESEQRPDLDVTIHNVIDQHMRLMGHVSFTETEMSMYKLLKSVIDPREPAAPAVSEQFIYFTQCIQSALPNQAHNSAQERGPLISETSQNNDSGDACLRFWHGTQTGKRADPIGIAYAQCLTSTP